MTGANIALRKIEALKRELERVAAVLSSPINIPETAVEEAATSILSCHDSVTALFVKATREYLISNYTYDPNDGHFYRAFEIGSFKKGSRVGVKNRMGYWQINVFERTQLAHRMVWLFVHGELPAAGFSIDHINGKTDDNRISNLRLATRSENSQNAAPQKTSASGVKGIYLHKQTGKWLARIKKNGVRKNLGLHDTAEQAADAYEKASREIFGDFAFVNRPVENSGESGDE